MLKRTIVFYLIIFFLVLNGCWGIYTYRVAITFNPPITIKMPLDDRNFKNNKMLKDVNNVLCEVAKEFDLKPDYAASRHRELRADDSPGSGVYPFIPLSTFSRYDEYKPFVYDKESKKQKKEHLYLTLLMKRDGSEIKITIHDERHTKATEFTKKLSNEIIRRIQKQFPDISIKFEDMKYGPNFFAG